MNSLFNMKGTERAAALLVILGKDAAADIMKHLDEESIEKLTREMVRIQRLESFEKEELFGEFLIELRKCSSGNTGGINKAREIVREAFGDEKAVEIIGRINQKNPEAGFAFLNDVDPSVVLSILSNENAQMIALVLSFLKPKKAGQILKEMPKDRAREVALKMAKLTKPSPEAAMAVSKAMKARFREIQENETGIESGNGINSLVNILSHMTSEQERSFIGRLDFEQPDLKKRILERIFVFDNIINLSNSEVRILIDEVNDDLIIAKALKGAGDDIRFKLLRNMSQNRATDIINEMELMGPVRIDEIERSRAVIVDIMKSLSDNGVITVKRDGEIYVD